MGLDGHTTIRHCLSKLFSPLFVDSSSFAESKRGSGRRSQSAALGKGLDMVPHPLLQMDQENEGFSPPARTYIYEITNGPVTDVMRMLVALLGGGSLSLLVIWLLARIRLRWKRNKHNRLALTGGEYQALYPPIPSSNMMVFESDITIDMILDDGDTLGTGKGFDDLSDHESMETIVSSVSATRTAFDIDELPPVMKGGILERRGRKDLSCDTSAYYNLNTIAMSNSPLSTHIEAKKTMTRPVFGFNFQEITPPVGSPLWNRKIIPPRAVCPGPLTHPPQFA